MRARMIRMTALSTGALLLSLLLAGASWAGKPFEGVVEMKSVERSKSPLAGGQEQVEEKQEITYYKQGKIKVVEQPGNRITIIRADKGLVWSVDMNNKTYTEMTFEQIAEMGQMSRQQMQQARSQMLEQLKNLPPEQRQMVEQFQQSEMGKMMGELMEGKYKLSWKRTDETDKILGYTCRKYIGLLNERPVLEAWVTDKYDIGENFEAMIRAYGMASDEQSNVEPLRGLPLKTVFNMDLGMGSVHEESIAVRVEEKKIPDSEFELPAGLRKEKSPFEEMRENMPMRPQR